MSIAKLPSSGGSTRILKSDPRPGPGRKEVTMGDKSPKATKKVATQKQTKSTGDQKKKKDADDAKTAAKTAKK